MSPPPRRARRDGLSLQGALGWAALTVVLLSALALGGNRPVSWTALSVALMPLFGLQLFCDLRCGLPPAARNLRIPAALIVAVLLWAMVQTLPGIGGGWAHPLWALVPEAPGRISAAPLAGHHHILRLGGYAMAFWIVARASASPARASAFLTAIALWSTGLALYGLAAVASGVNPILGDAAREVVSASFVNRNAYALYAVFGMLANLAAYLRMQAGNGPGDGAARRFRAGLDGFLRGGWVFAIGVLICLAALLATQSRAGVLAGLLGLLAYAVVSGRGTRGWLPVLALAGFALAALSGGVVSRLLSTDDEAPRFLIYPRLIDAILERPVLGHGLGAFRDVFRAYVPPGAAGADWELAHQSYLETALELGIPAAAAFYLALLLLAGMIFRGTRTRRRDREFACFAFAAIGAGAFHAFFDFSLQMPATAALFAVILGLGWAQAWPSQVSVGPEGRAPSGPTAPEPAAWKKGRISAALR